MAHRQAKGLVHLRILVRGRVQGVGFRPFIYRLATELALAGRVQNSPQGVRIELEGSRARLDRFLNRLNSNLPPRAIIEDRQVNIDTPVGYRNFAITASDDIGENLALISPDMALCPDCRREISDSTQRRFRYPFTNCTDCGPRFSIITALPYDRPSTTMRDFAMCAACRYEYENAVDRRYHAQPIACPQCGPHLSLWTAGGEVVSTHDAALTETGDLIRRGLIVAVKGLGGFHLIVDARNDDAVLRLRRRKAREAKPFALMFPDINTIDRYCRVRPPEKDILVSPEAPIVLLDRLPSSELEAKPLSGHIAPDNPFYGAMLPYTPLHYLLLGDLDFPIVATSGNVSDEPICIDNDDALRRLAGIADYFLMHNRPIARSLDDSIVQVMGGRTVVLRSARGYAPHVLPLGNSRAARLAVGAYQKNTIAVAHHSHIFVSQHIGDLSTRLARENFTSAVSSLADLYGLRPELTLADMHPDYPSTRFAGDSGVPVRHVQHHLAHVLSCMADNRLNEPVLGVAWDGAGLGADGTVWGGEFLTVDEEQAKRVAHFRTFGLPGGDKAAVEPRRAGLGMLYEMWGEKTFSRTEIPTIRAFTPSESPLLQTMLTHSFNTPRTSSAGRIFDAVASITGLSQMIEYEGQAAARLQYAAHGENTTSAYDFDIDLAGSPVIIDWEPMLLNIIDDMSASKPVGRIAARFHNTLGNIILAVCEQFPNKKVVLTGGCFQNKRLLEDTVKKCRQKGIDVFRHRHIPPNDGGIAAGQIVAPELLKHNGGKLYVSGDSG